MGLFKVNRVKLLQPEEFLSDTVLSRLCCPSSSARDTGTKVEEIFLEFIISSANNSPVVFKQERGSFFKPCTHTCNTILDPNACKI